jgi:energy-coupling factor transporter transmembrane protein EcfT
MGIGFVILIFIVFIAIISLIVAIFSGIFSAIFVKGEKRKRKILLAIFIPFHIFFSFFFISLIGSAIISENSNVDIGIGDSWYAPIDESHQILMIDLTEKAYIEKGEKTLLSEVVEIQQIGKKVIGKNQNGKYFTLNLPDDKILEFNSTKELQENENLSKLNLLKVDEFYQNKKKEASGIGTYFVGILSLIVSVLTSILIYKFVIYGKKLRK